MEELKVFEINNAELEELQYAVITTDKGAINIQLFPKDAPQAVGNFANLAKSGFYKGLNFHRVISGFMAQGGCPKGDGTGGPGYRIKCETENNPNKHNRGTISMAHAGKDTGGSQFFICFAPQPHLDGVHTTFGRIPVWDRTSYKVLDSIQQGDKILNIEIKEEIEREK
ncbi:peptidylprolyl isomerase [Helicobacter didelphidarum]|uniref:Peptidyl-prolyl cis-trans isomerase n=1 Tax=Helicobacter didelphidarum TaxID=2040648 RepID=A0A3D8ICF0_9HELI|nr:peptidylprolyl isomerase [Helicobacter didelphidarum]RDU62839.1 peptidylprolyl isomerase [Helicobacter didelphidarum]